MALVVVEFHFAGLRVDDGGYSQPGNFTRGRCIALKSLAVPCTGAGQFNLRKQRRWHLGLSLSLDRDDM